MNSRDRDILGRKWAKEGITDRKCPLCDAMFTALPNSRTVFCRTCLKIRMATGGRSFHPPTRERELTTEELKRVMDVIVMDECSMPWERSEAQ